MSLDSRLFKIAGMIRRGDRVADIGTDHAYLPVFLIRSGISKRVFACDVADGPLENAKANIERSNVRGIELRKGDGLAAVNAEEADTFVLAGMGGDLIAEIISAAPWVKNRKYELILQPMTSAEELRRYLCDNGFLIKEERAVSSLGRIYTVMKVGYTGERMMCGPLFYYFGKLTDAPGEDELIYIKRKRRIISKLAADIEGVERKAEQYGLLNTALEALEGLIEKWELTDYFYTDSKKN